jgi:Golgi phosphoprotein 3 (GPP34)
MPTVADELMLLAITEKGDVATSTWLRLDNGVAGAHLMDLALAGRVRLDDEVLVVADVRPTGDGPLDATLSEIAGDEPRSPKEWIGRLAKAEPHKAVVASLRERGVLREERSKVLGIFNRTRDLEADPEPEREVRARLRAALVQGGALDARTASLASLVSATELVGEAFPDPEDRKAAKRRLEELKEGDELRDALGAVNQAAVEAMLLAVTLMVAVTATTSATTIVNN